MTDLMKHGTAAFQLPPSAIISAAEADLRRRERNGGSPPYEHYAFHRKHVRKALSALDLIERAKADVGIGQRSSKRGTRLLYRPDALEAALNEGRARK